MKQLTVLLCFYSSKKLWIKANVTSSLLVALGNQIYYHHINYFLSFNQEMYVY